MSKKENRYTVYEHNEKAEANYVGTRFMGAYVHGKKEDPDSIFDVIAENVSRSDAHALIRNEKKSSHEAYLNSLPNELRSPDMDNFLRAIMEKGSREHLNK